MNDSWLTPYPVLSPQLFDCLSCLSWGIGHHSEEIWFQSGYWSLTITCSQLTSFKNSSYTLVVWPLIILHIFSSISYTLEICICPSLFFHFFSFLLDEFSSFVWRLSLLPHIFPPKDLFYICMLPRTKGKITSMSSHQTWGTMYKQICFLTNGIKMDALPVLWYGFTLYHFLFPCE